MKFDFALIKQHPVAIISAMVIGAIVVYLVVRKSPSVASSPEQPDLQVSAIDAGNSAAAQQYGAQVEMAQIAGQVQAQQTQAQLDAVKLETDAAQNIVGIQTAGAVQQTQITADATTEQTRITSQAKEDIATDYLHTSLAAIEDNNRISALNAEHQFDLEQSIVAGANQDKSRSSTGYAQIISAFEGQGPEAIAANEPAAVASSPAGIISSIGTALSNLF